MSDLRFALVSVHDKTGLDELATSLWYKGDYTILACGDIAEELDFKGGHRDAQVIKLSEYTGGPISPDNLIEMLHPKIHAGLLMSPYSPEDRAYMAKIGAFPIDFVAVNLAPFKPRNIQKNTDLTGTAEQINIGGVEILRAAARGLLENGRPIVVCDPKDYDLAVKLLEESKGRDHLWGKDEAINLAKKVFDYVAAYEKSVADCLAKKYG